MKHIFTFLLIILHFSGLFAQDCSVNISFTVHPNLPSGYLFKTDPQPEGAKYYWSFGDHTNSDMVSPSHTYKVGGTFTVQVKVSGKDGKICYGVLNEKFDGGTITPQPTILYAKGKVKKTPSSEACGILITLNTNTTIVPHEMVPAFEFKDGQYVEIAYELLKDIPSGCPAGLSANILKIKDITPIPVCKVPIAFLKSTVAPFTYSFSTDSQPDGSKYYWRFGDGGTSELAEPNYNFKKSGLWVINLKVVDPAGKMCYGEIKAAFESGLNPVLNGRGKVKKLSSEGCDFGIITENSVLIPVNSVPDFILKEGQYLEFTYGKYAEKITTCKEGTDIKLISVKEIQVVSSCKFDLVVKPKEATPNTFVFSTVSQAGISTWKWSLGDGKTSDLKDPEHTYEKPGIYEVSCTISTAAGCTETRTIKINVQPAALPNCSGAINILLFDPTENNCNGKATVKLMNDQGVEIANVKYLWSDNQTGSTIENLCPDKNYSVQASIEGICQKSYSFTFLTKPIWRSTSNNGKNSFSVVEPKPGIEYEWDFGNGTVLKGAEVTYDFETDGVYDVTLKAASGLDFQESSKQIVVLNSLTGSENLSKSEIEIYPNPVKDMLKINFGSPVSGKLLLEILNLAGKKVLSQQINSDGVGHAAIIIKQLPPAIYILRISRGKQIITEYKFIKAD